VWHHHRATVSAFWNQQAGYGEAEAWLHAQHPERFAAGEMLWRGRIYSPLPFVRSLRGRRVNTGTWGTAAFPSIYSTRTHPLQLLPHSPAWALGSTALVLASVLGLPGSVSGDPTSGAQGATWLMAAGVLGWTTTLVRCAMFARQTSLEGLNPIGRLSHAPSRVVYRLVIAWLHLIQPLARMRGRIRGIWSMPQAGVADAPDQRVARLSKESPSPSWRDVLASGRLLAGGACARSFWSESWVAHATLLTELAGVLRTARPAQAVEVDDGWHADRSVRHWAPAAA
jgi:hypothetical protein